APQSPMPQPYFVPVSRSSSRRYQRSGISGSPSKCRTRPLTVSWIMRQRQPPRQPSSAEWHSSSRFFLAGSEVQPACQRAVHVADGVGTPPKRPVQERDVEAETAAAERGRHVGTCADTSTVGARPFRRAEPSSI